MKDDIIEASLSWSHRGGVYPICRGVAFIYGLLVNTRFNVRVEPIVHAPWDVCKCFAGTEPDYLEMGDSLLAKAEQQALPDDERWQAIYQHDRTLSSQQAPLPVKTHQTVLKMIFKSIHTEWLRKYHTSNRTRSS